MGDTGATRFFRLVRNFFFSSVNKEFLIFLFFIFLSGTFWLVMTLNETLESEVIVPVKLLGIPKNVVLTSDEEDTIRVVVRDKGYALAAYTYGDAITPIFIDFKSYAKGDGKGVIVASDLKRLVEQRLYASSKVVQLKPERYEFFFNYGLNKRVPVKMLGKVTAGESFYIAKTRFSPDSVTIYASEALLDSLTFVYTENVQLSDITDTITQRVSIRKLRGVKCIPEEVNISFYPDVLTEESIEVPITPINVPNDKVLRTFPSRVKVSFVTGASLFRTIRPENFSVIVDYNEVVNHTSDKCNIYLRTLPHGVNKATVELKQVDYLIEQQ
jgi:hypothetical protein